MKDFLYERLQEIGMQPKKALGQNFLVSASAVEKILSTLPQEAEQPVVEIGPGPGSLTEGILDRGHQPILIELDRQVAQYWRERGLQVLEQDALKIPWDQFPEQTFLISNLPYQISASLVMDLSVSTTTFSKMTLMFQKEVAQRITASPKTSSYGLLSVVAQNFWKTKKLMDLSPRAFFPAPKVASRVLVFERKGSAPSLETRQAFLKFLKVCFHQKRKKLSNNLRGAVGAEGVRAALDFLAHRGHSENVRAEEVAPEDLKDLYFSVAARGNSF